MKFLPLKWEIIGLFVQNNVSKYVYAFPSIVFVILTTGIFDREFIRSALSIQIIISYLFFSIIYSIIGIAFNVICPREIKKYKNRDEYVSSVKDIVSPASLGEMRISIGGSSDLDKLNILEKFYDKLDERYIVVRWAITIGLAVGLTPTAVASIGRLFNIF